MGAGWIAMGMAAAIGLVPVREIKVYEIRPSLADPAVRAYDEPSYVLAAPPREQAAPLVVFLTGTEGRPAGAGLLLTVAARLGFRVIGLEYDDAPAVSQVCPQDPDPRCSELFRQMRITGEGGFRAVRNPPAEAIVPRLTAALRLLDRQHPKDGWGQYLAVDGPEWSRMVVSGMSQGAGMAAYIAQRHAVARVVLFSSPWDVTGPDHHPAPWLNGTGATPPDRWFAEYHEKEKTAGLIARAYAALGIPPDHIQVFGLDLPAGLPAGGSANPYHASTILDGRYAPLWVRMFGQPAP